MYIVKLTRQAAGEPNAEHRDTHGIYNLGYLLSLIFNLSIVVCYSSVLPILIYLKTNVNIYMSLRDRACHAELVGGDAKHGDTHGIYNLGYLLFLNFYLSIVVCYPSVLTIIIYLKTNVYIYELTRQGVPRPVHRRRRKTW